MRFSPRNPKAPVKIVLETTFICQCGNKRISNFYLGVEERLFISCPKCKGGTGCVKKEEKADITYSQLP